MKRIGILTAGGDTPALNATIYGAVERCNQAGVEAYGIIKGFSGLLDPRTPYAHLNPLGQTIPELDPRQGGTIIGSSRHYIDPNEKESLKKVVGRLEKLGVEGLICIGGDGTISGMQPISEFFPCVLAPKTIDNDLGLNYIDEPREWHRVESDNSKGYVYTRETSHEDLELDEIVNFATPGYATAVFVVAQSIQRIRTTAESHRRIAIVEVMGRDSGYISLGSAYGQPDMILIPEEPLHLDKIEQQVRLLYDLQKHAVIVIGEGVEDETGKHIGAKSKSFDPAGNVIYSGAAEQLKSLLCERLGDKFFASRRRHDSAEAAIFTRKVGHTQRGGRPIRFDRFHAVQLGGKATEILLEGRNNHIATLHWSNSKGYETQGLDANKLRDRWGRIHPRNVHPSMYDAERFQPSKFGKAYLNNIFSNAMGTDDVEHMLYDVFTSGNLTSRYRGFNIDMHKRIRYLDANATE